MQSEMVVLSPGSILESPGGVFCLPILGPPRPVQSEIWAGSMGAPQASELCKTPSWLQSVYSLRPSDVCPACRSSVLKFFCWRITCTCFTNCGECCLRNKAPCAPPSSNPHTSGNCLEPFLWWCSDDHPFRSVTCANQYSYWLSVLNVYLLTINIDCNR